ncbi:MAG: gamma-glutamyl-gamma-aminobutyrate hydrolase family protein [Christensenellaceae bacterium]
MLLSIRPKNASNYVKMLEYFNVKPVFSPSENCDGLILCGGGDITPCLYKDYSRQTGNYDKQRDYYEMFLIKKFLSQNKPIFGICKGLQMLNLFFGGELIDDIKRKDIHYSYTKNDNSHPVFIAHKSRLHNSLKSLGTVNSYHHQAIKTVNNRLIATLYSYDLCVEALEGRREKIFATQFHPERMTKKFDFKGYDLFGEFLRCYGIIG